MINERRYSRAEVGQRTLVPAPERLPVECWQPIQSGSERAFDFMAKYGISGVIGGGSAEGGAHEARRGRVAECHSGARRSSRSDRCLQSAP